MNALEITIILLFASFILVVFYFFVHLIRDTLRELRLRRREKRAEEERQAAFSPFNPRL